MAARRKDVAALMYDLTDWMKRARRGYADTDSNG
jgi:hypothetical protein